MSDPMDDDEFSHHTGSDSMTVLKQECENYDQYFLHMSLLPAVAIILLLSLLERRKRTCACERNLLCLSGRFSLVVPVDFTSTQENRWSYAFAFGAVTQHMVSLTFGISNPLPFTIPPYLKVFMYMVAAIKVGVACMPLFICLSTSHQLLGGVLGLLYAVFWFSLQMWELVWCSDSTADKGGLRNDLKEHEWLLDFPNLLCLGFLVCRFGFQIVKDVLIWMKKLNKQEEVTKEHYKYVQRLLRRPAERSEEQKSWFQKKVYEWDPYFKFPNRIIATVVLSFLSLYMMILLEQVSSTYCMTILHEKWKNSSFLTDVLGPSENINYPKYTWYVSSACAAFSSLIHIIHVLVYYRKHIKSMWAGEKNTYPGTTSRVLLLVCVLAQIPIPDSDGGCQVTSYPLLSKGGLLKYPGYQIAFTLWGYLIVHLAMFVGGLVFVYMVVHPIQSDGFLHWLNDVIIVLANFFVVLAVMALQRMFIHMFFLQDKNSPLDKDKPLALNNRKVFHNVNYFLFFFNVILGLMSCILRLMKSTAVGLLLLSRIERTIMPQGFEKLDKSYCTWLGMIVADHHHSNPVLLCFCHLLHKHTLWNVQTGEGTFLHSERPEKLRARARWLLMYTLVRNPTLILMRKRAEQNRKDSEFAFAWAVSNTSYAQAT